MPAASASLSPQLPLTVCSILNHRDPLDLEGACSFERWGTRSLWVLSRSAPARSTSSSQTQPQCQVCALSRSTTTPFTKYTKYLTTSPNCSPTPCSSARRGRGTRLPQRQDILLVRLRAHQERHHGRRPAVSPRAQRPPQPLLHARVPRPDALPGRQDAAHLRGQGVLVRPSLRHGPALRHLAAHQARRPAQGHCRYRLPELRYVRLPVVGPLEHRRQARLHQLQPDRPVAVALSQGRHDQAVHHRSARLCQCQRRRQGRVAWRPICRLHARCRIRGCCHGAGQGSRCRQVGNHLCQHGYPDLHLGHDWPA